MWCNVMSCHVMSVSIHPSIHPSIHLICLSVYLCICVSVSLCVCVYVCPCMSVCVSVCLYVCLPVCMYVCLYVCILYVCMSVCLYVCMSVCLYVCMFVCMFVCMHGCMHVCMYLQPIKLIQWKMSKTLTKRKFGSYKCAFRCSENDIKKKKNVVFTSTVPGPPGCICMHVCKHACLHACLLACLLACLFVCVRFMYMHIYIYMYVCMSVCLSLSLSVSVSVYVYVCMYVYVCVCICISTGCQHPTACDTPTHLPCTVLGYRSPYPAASKRAGTLRWTTLMILIYQLCDINMYNIFIYNIYIYVCVCVKKIWSLKSESIWKAVTYSNTPGPQGPSSAGDVAQAPYANGRVLMKSRLRPPTSRPQWC